MVDLVKFNNATYFNKYVQISIEVGTKENVPTFFIVAVSIFN